MNRHIVTLTAISLAMSFGVVAMEEEPDAPKFTPPSFADVDANKDGSVSIEELNAYRATMQEEMGNDNGKQMNRRDSISAFASFDKDKDGVITQEEFEAHARYSNPGNGSGQLKTYKNTNKMNNSNKNKSSGQGSGKSNGKGNSN